MNVSRQEGTRIALAYVRQHSVADRRYVEAVKRAGGFPVPLWADDAGWQAKIADVAGIIFTGGGDIDLLLYGRRDLCPTSLEIDRARDEREMAVFAYARERQLPLLGICRGMQFLNVVYEDGGLRGGLVEDLPRGQVRHRVLADKSSAFHSVIVNEGTKLASMLGRSGLFTVNSRHHQGVKLDHLAAGLVASAIAADGVVEGIELPGDWFLAGVQCHPERVDEVPEFGAVITALLDAAALWRRAD